ncbi:unnamed protein product [Coregonus sp. 'balchen']|nr:unnamed protein product [Coregonus sp. 'balchen']
MTEAMTCFINEKSSTGLERSYFLKWIGQYKEKCQNLQSLTDRFITVLWEPNISYVKWNNVVVQPKSKILVVTVQGVQSMGKLTLLNTMFGVQFAVSSGRCQRRLQKGAELRLRSQSTSNKNKNMIKVFQNYEASGNNNMDLLEWIKSLWNSVKYGNVISSFRDSLVADAYIKLCVNCRKSLNLFPDLDREFEKVWEETVQELIEATGRNVFNQLQSNMVQMGGSVNEKLNKNPIKIFPAGFFKKLIVFYVDEHTRKTQAKADKLIAKCKAFVLEG